VPTEIDEGTAREPTNYYTRGDQRAITREDWLVMEIRRVGSDEWSTVRKIRLAALLDSPDWFWTTYDEEVTKPERWWRDRITAGAWFIAQVGGRPVGIAAAISAPELKGSDRQLVSMWVEPGSRGRGIGSQLVEAIKTWALADGADGLQLQVTEGNHVATRLYERCGFQLTGRTEALARSPALIEREMRLVL
jgi:GNAT superfamily N-acetyltransferase